MLSKFSSSFGILHGLEQGAEDSGADRRPIESACLHEEVPHAFVERRDRGRLSEDPTVDIREPGENVVEVALALAGLAVHGLEKHRELWTEISSVFVGSTFEELVEEVAFPDRSEEHTSELQSR